ncbi:MAG: hypothetical protein ACFB14_24665 [Leptolyngbyaceae cyanobacterium]
MGSTSKNLYFDVLVEYAKTAPEDILIKITIATRGSEAKTLTVLITLWFRNTWSWAENVEKPILKLAETRSGFSTLDAVHSDLGHR